MSPEEGNARIAEQKETFKILRTSVLRIASEFEVILRLINSYSYVEVFVADSFTPYWSMIKPNLEGVVIKCKEFARFITSEEL